MRAARILANSVALAAGITLVATAQAFAAPAEIGSQTINYVALGDSYASGVGAGNYGSSGSCYRSSGAYGPLWASAHGASLSFQACSGAKTSDVLNNQLGPLNSGTNLVTITIGGNDSGFTNVMESCDLGSDSSCKTAVQNAENYATNTLPGQLDNVYSTIREKAPNAKVVVLGYPHMYQLNGSCSAGNDDTKRGYINQGADVLDGVIQKEATNAGFTFADVRGAFTGHEICSSDWWLHSVTWPVYESYHPTANGQSKGYLPTLDAVTG